MAAQAAVVQQCDVCDSEDNVRWYCKDCHEVMCDFCKAVHLRSRKTKNDEVIPLSQARDIQKIPAIWCDIHTSEEVCYYCQPCDKLICIKCLVENHKEHKCISLGDYRNDANKELEDVKEKFSNSLLSGQRKLDMERDTFERKSANFEKIEADIKNHSDKIIHEVTNMRDEMLRSVAETRQKELDRYNKIKDSIQSKNAEKQSEMVKLTSLRENENPAVLMKSINAAIKALTQLEEKYKPPSSSLAKFQSGKINVHALQLMFGTCMLNIRSGNGSVDKSKVKVISTITVPRKKGYIKTIIPDKQGHFWVSTSDEDYFTLIQNDGKVVKKSARFAGHIKDAVALNDSILVTNENETTKVTKFFPASGAVSTFSYHDPYITGGLCTTADLDVLVCLQLGKRCQIARLGQDAVVKQIIQGEKDNTVMFESPCRITSLYSGEILVTSWFRIACIDRNGSRLFDCDAKLDGQLAGPRCITKDRYNNVFVSDNNHNRVFLLGLDGSITCLLDHSMGIDNPWAIAVVADGQLMIGCTAGRIICVEY